MAILALRQYQVRPGKMDAWLDLMENQAERKRLYAAFYEAEYWKQVLASKVGSLIDREARQVQRVLATRLSPIQQYPRAAGIFVQPTL